MGKEVPLTPAGMVTVEGTMAAGESLERLTSNPPAPASPLPARETHPVICAPPVAVVGPGWAMLSLSVGGRTVNWLEAETPLSVAVRVTRVGAVTCPTVIGNWAQACEPGM